MTKSIKRFMVVSCATLLAFMTLCTSAFAAGTIDARVSGDIGNKTISYSYSVNSDPTIASIGFFTTTEKNTYSFSFSPASGSSATIYFYNWGTEELLYSLTVPMSGGGMPSSFLNSVDLGKNRIVYIKIQSNSSTSNANGWFTIEGVYYEFEVG